MSRSKSNKNMVVITGKRLGLHIHEKREQKGISIQAFAERIGLSVHHIDRIEKGDEMPSLSLFIAIVFTLGCCADELLFDYLQSQGNVWREDNFCSLMNTISDSKRDNMYNLCVNYSEILRKN